MPIDLAKHSELKIAPRAVFDSLAERGSRVRFMVPIERVIDGRREADWRAVTWSAFARDIRRVARFLSTVGVASSDRCAIYAPNRVEWMTAALAIQAAGGVMVPIYGSSTADQAAYVAEHADAKVVFVDTAFLLQRVIERWTRYRNATHVVLLDDDIDVAAVVAKVGDGPSVAEVEAKIVTWSQTLGRGASVDARDPAAFEHVMQSVSLDQPGVMLYTSGTSGNPKGVPLTHRNVGTNGRDWLECNAPLLREGMVDLLWLPMSHIFGFGEACLGNTLGFTSYLCDPRVVLEKLVEVKPSVLMSVPSIWEKLAAPLLDPKASDDPVLRRNSLSAVTGGALEFCLSGGAGLKREVKEAFHRAGLLIVEGYGLTETSPTLTLNRPTAFRFDTVGRVLPSVEVKLAEDGEIFARGPSVFGGYHKDAVATADAFTADGWFKTGDVGRFTDDGFLQIIDRKKDILVTAGGKNVAPANVEIRFDGDPLIAHVVVYGDARKFLVAGIWVHPEAASALVAGVVHESRAAELSRHIQARVDRVNGELAPFESIKKFVVFHEPLTIDAGMLTPTLKVRRKKIYEAFGSALEALYS